jgi:hypothetical protein
VSAPRPWRVFVISARRPLNVPAMHQRWFGTTEPVTWVVPEEDAEAYAAAGAQHLLPVPHPPAGSGRYPLPAARNAALHAATAAGQVCIQTDDDLRRLCLLTKDGKRRDVPWPRVRDLLIGALDGSARLAGTAPTSNVLSARHTTTRAGFILGSLCATDAATPRWDETIPLKEDYDYSCAHITTYGQVARMNWIIPDYAHYSNRGGAVSFRNEQNENETTRLLLARWPQYLKPHPSRPHELSFRRTGAPARRNP